MFPASVRTRLTVFFTFVICIIIGASLRSDRSEAKMAVGPIISATQTVGFAAGGDVDADGKADPGETHDLATQHPQILSQVEKRYDAWWDKTLPLLENEQAYKTAPAVNPFKELYWKQYNGPGPNNVPPGTVIKPG